MNNDLGFDARDLLTMLNESQLLFEIYSDTDVSYTVLFNEMLVDRAGQQW